MNHIADLEGLIYYNYFVLGKRLEIFVPDGLKEEFFNVFPMDKYNKEYQNGIVKEIMCMYKIKTDYALYEDNTHTYSLEPFEANYSVVKAYGYKIKKITQRYYNGTSFTHESVTKAIISGDSKANFSLLKIAKNALSSNIYDIKNPLYIFHDYSNWDDVTRNVHCCATDFNLVYHDLINGENKKKVKFIKYHNGDNVDLEIKI